MHGGSAWTRSTGWSMFCVHLSVTMTQLIYNLAIQNGITGDLATKANLPIDR